MKPITVSPQSKTLNDLLKKARRRDVLLESADGEQFVLARVTDLRSFVVGDSDDFAGEVTATRHNKRLMKFLDERTTESTGQK
jgi:predicted transcriptional regulator